MITIIIIIIAVVKNQSIVNGIARYTGNSKIPGFFVFIKYVIKTRDLPIVNFLFKLNISIMNA